jgi:hypothetical protein
MPSKGAKNTEIKRTNIYNIYICINKNSKKNSRHEISVKCVTNVGVEREMASGFC